MRVLVVTSEMPPITSGVARSCAHLVNGLSERGHDVDVVAAPEVKRWTIGEFRFSSFIGRWFALRRQLPSYDVVNVHGPVPTLSDVFLALAQTVSPVRRPPIVYTHHSEIEIERFPALSQAYNRLNLALMRYADRVITTTPSYRAILEDAQKGFRLEVVPWGVEYERYAGGRHVRRTDGDRPLRILFVGQMRPYKGVDNLIRAVAGKPWAELTVVGQGPSEAAYRELAGAAANIRFLNRVHEDVLPALFGDHDVVALPSTTRAEAFGLVLLEGMAAGCVPVASDLPGVRDVVERTGLLVRPGDVSGLRDALRTLAFDENRRRWLARVAQVRASTLRWTDCVGSYERIFDATCLDWKQQIALSTLPHKWASPEPVLESISRRFRASWASLLLFDRSRDPTVRAGWGAFDIGKLRSRAPRIAQYIARTRRPMVLDREQVPQAIQPWLLRSDISSALATPIRSHWGTLVLNLSIAAGTSDRDRYTPDDLASLVRLVG